MNEERISKRCKVRRLGWQENERKREKNRCAERERERERERDSSGKDARGNRKPRVTASR